MGSRLTFAVLFLLASEAYAAQDAAPVPTASQYPVLPMSRLDAVLPAPLDLAQIAQEDAARDQKGLPPRFAIADAQSIRPDNRGTWEDLGDGGMLWRLRIVAGDGVNSLNLGFTRFTMSPHGRLLLYSTDGRQILRPFTSTDNEAHGQLWTPVVLTNDLIVELTVPKAEVGAVDLLLGSINQGYRGFGTVSSKLYEKSGGCNLDVECLGPGDAWRDPMRSVGVISTGGTTFCSGSLVNDTAQDHKMYFMTANHCALSAGNAASLVVFWNYQNSFCRTPGSAASGQAGDGALTQFHTGSFFRAASAASDFMLVELDDPPVLAFNHYWAGWDRSPGDFTCTPGAPCAGIHHPNTEEKRVTYVTTNTATTSYLGTTSPGAGTHVWAHWATDPPGPFTVPGVTEPGSSGSPLYSDAGRFIGQLHGGPSACGATGNNLSDYYGRFSVSWTGGGTDSTRLSNWLDAGGTGAQTVDGINTAPTPTRGMYAISPCRLVDTRNPAGPLGGPALAASSTRTFALADSCSVPATATALAVNLTAVDATAPGHLKAYAAGATPPSTSAINFVPGVTRANNAILVVDANGAIEVENASAGTVNFILDVVGYFRP